MDKTSTERSPKRFDDAIEELKGVLASKGLTSGQPRDLVIVAQALRPLGAVREDVAAAIRAILARDAVGLSRAEMATMFVVAVGGKGLTASGQEVEAIGQLDGFVDWVMAPLANVSLEGDAVAQAVDPFWGIVPPVPAPVGAGADESLGEESKLAPERNEVEGDRYPPALAAFVSPSRSKTPRMVPRGSKTTWIAAACVAAVLLTGGLIWRLQGSSSGRDGGTAPETIGSSVSPNVSASQDGSVSPSSGAPPVVASGPSAGQTSGAGAAGTRDDTTSARPGPGADAKDTISTGVVSSTQKRGAPDASVGQTAGVAVPVAGQDQHHGPEASKPTISAVKPTASSVAKAAQTAVPTGKFVVSSGVMSGHLIKAPEPSYPKMAKMWGIQGEVVLQAVVSRKGQVVAAHALDGHRMLRGPAMNAVKKWRYTPYMKDGKPTDVETVVIVDFRLPS